MTAPHEDQAQVLLDQLEDLLAPVRDALRGTITVAPRLKDSVFFRALFARELFAVCGGIEPDDSAATVQQNELASERVEAILAFIDLAKGHSLPRKLLPRGDRRGGEFTPGEIVVVMGQHRGVVEPPYDEVRVKLDAGPRSTWPSWAIAREGEQWTPPTSTPH